jgi:hypothetical protein
MVAIEIRVEDQMVKVRRFGTGEFKKPAVIQPGDADRLTGLSFDELRHLGNGVWGFEEGVLGQPHSPSAT